MGRVLLLVLGFLVVAGLILAPEPEVEDRFRLAVGDVLAGPSAGEPPVFDPVRDRFPSLGDGAGDPLTFRFDAASTHTSGFDELDPEWRNAQVSEALERAINFANGERPKDEENITEPWPKVVWIQDAEPADLALSLRLRAVEDQESAVVGLAFDAQWTVDGVPAEAVGEASSELTFPERTSLLPPLLAISIAIAFRRVLISLFACIWLAAALLTWSGTVTSPWSTLRPASWVDGISGTAGAVAASAVEGFLRVFDVFFVNQLLDSFRIEILAFTLFLTASVGVMSRSGGMRGLVDGVARMARGIRGTQLATWFMGLIVFFDDYANCIMVGTTMRPLTDRLRIAREKLAFLVDATAAPISAIAVLSTWVAFEVSTFSAQLPSVGVEEDAYAIFIKTIPYRYYALFMLGFVALTILFQRDFGPMLRAERRARRKGLLVAPGSKPMVSDELTKIEPRKECGALARRALVPLFTVLLVTLGSIWVLGGGPLPWGDATGWQRLAILSWSFELPSLQAAGDILYEGAGGKPILFGAFSGFVMAVFLATGIGVRFGLIAGWILAAQLTGPTADALLERLPQKLHQAAQAPDEGELRFRHEFAGFVRDAMERDRVLEIAGDRVDAGATVTLADGTSVEAGRDSAEFSVAEPGAVEPGVRYVVFFLWFLACCSALGLIASALTRERNHDDAGPGVLQAAEAVRAALASSRAMVLAFCILFLAWMIGAACEELGTAPYLVAQFGGQLEKVYWLLPTLLFLTACLVSFSTGSSWSTMGILLPIVVVLSYRVGEATGNPDMSGMVMLILSIGAVLEGSIFGDHCSPISDTTVLSSTSSASDHIDHVRTQMPYAILVMVVAITIGYIPQAFQLSFWSSWHSLGVGLAVLALFLLVFGRNPARATAEKSGGPGDDLDALDPAWSPVRGTPDRARTNGEGASEQPPYV